MIQQITDYLARLQNLEIEQFRNAPNTVVFLSAIADQMNEVEAVIVDVISNRWLSTAAGVQLDVLGKIIGEPRRGRSDADYRAALQQAISLNRSGGTIESIIAGVLFFAQASVIEIVEQFPAAFIAQVESPVASPVEIKATINASKAAGIGLLGLVETGSLAVNADYTVPDEPARLALTSPPLAAGDTVLQLDTGDVWTFLGGDPSLPGSWELTGPPFVFSGDSTGDGFADLNSPIGGGVLGNLL